MQQVTNTWMKHNQGTPVQLKDGDIFRAKILERNNGNKAMVSIYGNKHEVKFEGSLPKQDNVFLQVTEKKEDVLNVRTIEKHPAKNSAGNVDQINSHLKKAGVGNPDDNLIKAAKVVQKKGIPLTKETVQEMKQFFATAEGSDSKKLITVQAAAVKQVDITEGNLRSIHESLHGKGASDFLNTYKSSPFKGIGELDQQLNEAVKNVIRASTFSQTDVNKAIKDIRQQTGASFDDIKTVVRSRLLDHPEVSMEQRDIVEKALKEREYLNHTGQQRVKELLRERGNHAEEKLLKKLVDVSSSTENQEAIKKQLQSLLSSHDYSKKEMESIQKMLNQLDQLREAGNQRVLDSLKHIETLASTRVQAVEREDILLSLKKKINQEPDLQKVVDQIRKEGMAGQSSVTQDDVDDLLKQSSILLAQGKEMAARQLVHEGIELLQEATVQHTFSQSSISSVYFSNEQFQTTVPLKTKQLLETRITEKMAQVTDEFAQMKKDTGKQLDQAVKLLQQDRQSVPQAKQIVEAAIKQLDRAMLRSEAALFTDMKTERKLLEASGQLAEARKLLGSGKLNASVRIVKEVQNTLQNLSFSPAEQKVKQFIVKERLFSNHRTENVVSQVLEQGRHIMQDPSARQTFELVRMLGLNRESEIGQMLASKELPGSSSTHQQNVKDVLLQLLKSEETGNKAHQQANQALANLNGQQLLCKSDQGNPIQHLLFNLPIPLKEENEQLKVYVQSRQEGEQLDWENCNLYFLINTPALGETGIMIQAAERQLSITVKNDQPDFQKKMGALVEKTTSAITELGYQLNDIHYQPLHHEDTETIKEDEWMPFYTEKGFDYKV